MRHSTYSLDILGIYLHYLKIDIQHLNSLFEHLLHISVQNTKWELIVYSSTLSNRTLGAQDSP